jgi:hypothetical protein
MSKTQVKKEDAKETDVKVEEVELQEMSVESNQSKSKRQKIVDDKPVIKDLGEEPKGFISFAEASTMLDMPKERFQMVIKSGSLPAFWTKDAYVVRKADVEMLKRRLEESKNKK